MFISACSHARTRLTNIHHASSVFGASAVDNESENDDDENEKCEIAFDVQQDYYFQMESRKTS